MTGHDTTSLRNVGIMAHIDAGKTTVSERLLFYAGKTHKLGEVHDGHATMDFMEAERERGITISAAATTLEWNDHAITLIDTPGHVDFTAEVERSLRVLDGAVALFCAVGGVQPQSEQVWRQSEKYETPKIVFINKMDRTGADFFGVLDEIRATLGANPIPIVLPIGSADTFSGIIDLLTQKAWIYDSDALGEAYRKTDIPDALLKEVEQWRSRLMEACAEEDETLLEKYLNQGSLSENELRCAIRKAAIARRITPVFCGSAFKNKGIQRLLDGIIEFLPSPLDIPPITGQTPDGAPESRRTALDQPLAALAFKIVVDRHIGKLVYLRVYSGAIRQGDTLLNPTTRTEQRIGRLMRMHANRQESIEFAGPGEIIAAAGLAKTRTGETLCSPQHPVILETISFPAPVISVSIKPTENRESEKAFDLLHRLVEEDPTFTVAMDPETSETILSGMGELHLEVLIDRLRREFNVSLQTGQPEVALRETISIPSEGQWKHAKQTGGRGQYAHVFLTLEPLPSGSGFEFVNKVRGGRIPAEFIPSVQKGVVKAMAKGPFAAYPVVDIRVSVTDGSFHAVDSSDMAFQEAARQCFRDCFTKAKPILIEPIMSVEIITPEDYVGPASGSICQRRGRIDSMEMKHESRVISGMAPLSEMFGYANVIRTLTQGRASFSMRFDRYETVPQSLTEAVLRKRREQNKIH